MAVPLATTTIAVKRTSGVQDYDDTQPTAATVATGVRAHISSPSGFEQAVGGSEETVAFRLSCDLVDLAHTDTVLDEQTGETYQVTWARQRLGLGLDHVQAGLQQTAGAAS